MALPLCRLYLITPPRLDDLAAFGHILAQALDAGDVAALQIRGAGALAAHLAPTQVFRCPPEGGQAVAPIGALKEGF